ncbi:MAG TPA: hypothetical protein DFI00_02235 [Rhodospirillaceae bacterium]|nr:hypothetical protein [Alphaproteobacteria bacterium]OUT39589.1 MAG: hypothetical protein CBB62_14585 [Micavibrio sp. TMED2]HCI46091.1 hypothetical protein [Rhodospirillaceae bacterium]MAS48980.1 hypothetical protein [Alphaproteobacteria bacterium]MAX97418.1 hypothetical protein [Alphaproteobacteria bacterium]|tara:strand:- start:1411 stop:1776 length:366 start_codon:yes stop_codon:yes gene_type:complete
MTGITPELLIRLARTTLTEDVLGQEADAVKYPVLMIANALAIAERQMTMQDAVDEQLAAQMQAWLAGHGAGDGHDAGEALRLLADRIRAGAFDHDRDFAEQLMALLQAELAIFNPKFSPQA